MAPIQEETEQNNVEWYAMCAVVLGSVACLVAAAVGVYKFYNRKPPVSSARQHVSSAIKPTNRKDSSTGSLRTSPSGIRTFPTPVRGTRGGNQPAYSPTEGGQSRMLGGNMARSPTQEIVDDKASMAETHPLKEPEIRNDDAVSPTEKDLSLRETAVDDLKMNRLGNLYFSVEYDNSHSALIVTVTKATDLPVKDKQAMTSDPYIKLQLLPDKRHKVKTRVLRKTLDPVYEEIFTFYGINYNHLQTITLHFAVLSFDRFSRDDVIGEVLLPLAGQDLGKEGEMMLCKEIQPRHIKIHSHGRGELLVSLCYQPVTNRLTVVVLKAKNLPKMDITGLSDPYIKVYLLYSGQRIAKKKTHVKKRTLNPVYNESFLFDVPCNEGLQNISVEFLVLDWDRMTKNEVIGRLEIGPGETQQPATTPPDADQKNKNVAGLSHWEEVKKNPRKMIAHWHKLKE